MINRKDREASKKCKNGSKGIAWKGNFRVVGVFKAQRFRGKPERFCAGLWRTAGFVGLFVCAASPFTIWLMASCFSFWELLLPHSASLWCGAGLYLSPAFKDECLTQA